MKTTVDIAEPLLKRAKRLAATEGTTLRELIEKGLQRVLDEQEQAGEFVLRDGSFGGQGVQPGIQEGDWDTLRDLIYQGHGA